LHRTKYDFYCTATFLIKLVSVAGEWKIISFDTIYHKDNIEHLVNSGEIVFRVKYPRESYRCLAFVVETTQGYKVDENLPGWDRPEEAMLILEQARKWVTDSN